MNFGAKIRELREQRGWKQAEVATRCGWERTSRISMYERGEREPALADIRRLAQVFGVTAGSLVEDGEVARPLDEDLLGIAVRDAVAYFESHSKKWKPADIGEVAAGYYADYMEDRAHGRGQEAAERILRAAQ